MVETLAPAITGTIEDLAHNVLRRACEWKLTLATAESCTGGMLAEHLTHLAGSSNYFLGGVVCYSNQMKTALAGVPASLIEAKGAVSAEVASALADGIRKSAAATIGIGITGIAGPGGGTPEKPVGTVFIALATAEQVEVKKLLNVWERATFKQVTATQALEWLRQRLSAPVSA